MILLAFILAIPLMAQIPIVGVSWQMLPLWAPWTLWAQMTELQRFSVVFVGIFGILALADMIVLVCELGARALTMVSFYKDL